MKSHLLLVTLGFIYVWHHGTSAYRTNRFGCSSDYMTDAERDLFLSYHNDARLRVARGAEWGYDATLGPAKNMYKLKWDCSMEEQALNAIREDCTYPGDSMDIWNDTSINVDIRYEPEEVRNHMVVIAEVLEDWWSAVGKYGVYDLQNRYVDEKLASFAKMVFSKTTKLGCGYKVCTDGNMVTVCLYNKIATTYAQQMWESGKACESGSDCTTYNDSSCDSGLCVEGGSDDAESEEEEDEEIDKTTNDVITPSGTSTPSTTSSSTTTAPGTTSTPSTPNTTSIPGSTTSTPSIQCSQSDAMTDEAREAALTMHNKFRSSLARGLEKNGLGGNAPKASQMLKMIYDCELEASAMNNVKHCIFEHSEGQFGENLFMIKELNLDKATAIKEASKKWWSELSEFGIGQDNILTQELFYSTNHIGHYTQMAWETSYKLGCAVQHCDAMTYVVCHYAPRGNFVNRLIYTPGEPCQTDDNCPGSYTCSKDEGLCNVV